MIEAFNTAVNLLFIVLLSVLLSSIIIACFFGIYCAYLIWKKNKDRQKKALEMVLLEVSLPRENEIKIDAAEQMFSAFSGIKGVKGLLGFSKVADSIVFEIVARPGDIRFYVSMPKKLQDMVEKQIHGSYQDAEITEVEEYDLFPENSKVAFAGLQTKGPPYEPLKVFKEIAVDPMSTMASTLGKMQEGEAAAIQILITPTDGKWKKFGRSYISGIKKREANPETAKYSVDQKELESIENKISKPAFSTFVRLVVASSTKEAADAHLSNMVTAFNQFSGHNSFKKEKFKYFKGMFMVDFIYRTLPLLKKGSVLTTEELATIFHFPNKSVESPNIHWLGARSAPAPASIPTSGLYIGKSVYRGTSKPIYIGEDDRRRHM